MKFAEHVVVSGDCPCTHSYIESGHGQTVVWLKGEHDVATVDELAALLAEAIALSRCDIVVDLSGVDFMAVAPVRALTSARSVLEQQSLTMVLRAPSRSVRVIFGLCRVDLTPPKRGEAASAAPARHALESFVAVPARAPSSAETKADAARRQLQSGRPGSTAPSEETVSRAR